MSDVLDKAAAIIEARTPGPWSMGMSRSPDNKFISLMGSTADSWLAVVRAAKEVTSDGYGYFTLNFAIEKLEVDLAKCLEGK